MVFPNLSQTTPTVHVNFLTTLFGHRKAFHDMAGRMTAQNTMASTVVCWVDILLAKLSVFVMNIAGGFSPNFQDGSLSGNLKLQQEADCVRAAAQLPGKCNFPRRGVEHLHILR